MTDKKSGQYYSGQGGVFYNPENDSIFHLKEKGKREFITLKTGNCRSVYIYDIEYSGGKIKDSACEPMSDHIIRLGDL